MATITKEIPLEAGAEQVWDAVRDYGAVHQRLGPGFAVDCRLEAGARIVTFANGMVARELIVNVDDEARRIAYSIVGGQLSHHNASMQVFDQGEGRSKLVWTADLLPNEAAPMIREMTEQACVVMKRTLERA